MTKSRARPAAVEEASVPPPAKRRKPLPDARSNGFESILLDNKNGKKLATAYTTKSSHSNTARVDDQKTVVSTRNGHSDVDRSGGVDTEIVEISSDHSSDSDEEEDEEAAEEVKVNGHVNGVSHDTLEVEQQATNGLLKDGDEMDEEADGEEPSFGERIQAQHAEPIDVEAALAQAEDESNDEAQSWKYRIPTGATFSTVLTQSLKTTDNKMLESCFESTELEIVRETISRLDSRLIVSLMQRIAERISKRPGRLGNLMVWIQWAIIAHGGYLAGQREMVKRLASLNGVIKERADGLQPLLQLKGKLDMLSAQLDLRRDIQERNAKVQEDEEGAVAIYVESEEDEVVSEQALEDLNEQQRLLFKGMSGTEIDASDDDEEAGLGTFANGIVKADVEASDSSDAEEGLFDDEAEETDNDEEESDDEASDDEDSD
jgi:U3 small nucleolar RNA-associated protein 5